MAAKTAQWVGRGEEDELRAGCFTSFSSSLNKIESVVVEELN